MTGIVWWMASACQLCRWVPQSRIYWCSMKTSRPRSVQASGIAEPVVRARATIPSWTSPAPGCAAATTNRATSSSGSFTVWIAPSGES